MEIISGINRECKDSLGGVKELYLSPYTKVRRSEAVFNSNVLTAFPLIILYRFEVVGDINVNDEVIEDEGGKYYSYNISFKIKKHPEITKLLNKDYRIIIKDNNQLYRMYGVFNGMTCDNISAVTGSLKTDFNGLNLTFSGREEKETVFLNDIDFLQGSFLLQENGFYLLQENGFKILL